MAKQRHPRPAAAQQLSVPPAARRQRHGLLLLIPLVLAALAYWRILDAPFVLDDLRVVVRAPGLRDLGGTLARLASAELWRGGRPVVDATLALDLALFGQAPRSFHVTNLLLHLAVAALLFQLGRTVLRRAGADHPGALALAVAGAWALHPLQTQAVTYVTQRAEVLASGCYAATLLGLLSVERRGFTAAGTAAFLGSLLAFALGLGTKVIVLTAPAAFLLLGLAWPPGTPPPRRRRWLLVAPHLALAAVVALAQLRSIEGHVDAGFSIPGLPAWRYLAAQPGVLLTYLRLVLWPAGQSVEWLVEAPRALDGPTAAAGAAVLGLLALAAWLLWHGRRRPDGPGAAAQRTAGVGLLWFFLVLSPTSSVVPLADLLAEHRPYLASLGLLLAVALGVQHALARLPAPRARVAAVAVTALAWAALGLATHRRNAAWESPVALYADAVAKAPRHARAHFGLATALHERGDLAGAIEAYRAALELSAGQPLKERQVAHNLGVALLGAGRLDEAAAALERALALEPDSARLASLLGQVEWRRGDLARAEAYAGRALALEPGNAEALLTAGVAQLARGDAAGGLARLEAAARAEPGDATIQLNLGLAYDLAGRAGPACTAWGRALAAARTQPLRDGALHQLQSRGCAGAR